MDGNTAAAYVAYAFIEIAPIYPITPSSAMAELVDEQAAQNKLNLWGNRVKVTQMQSEAGAAGVLHGSLAAGALAATFTASQGLLLMLPNMYKIAGELLPAVMYVASRSLATHALSIFSDHSDIYACRATGFAILCCNNVQEIMDLSPIAHLAAIEGRIPFLNFFDGFRTSHEIQKIDVWKYEQLKELLNNAAISNFKAHAMDPSHPTIRGTTQNSDVFFQNREANNIFYQKLPSIVEKYMSLIQQKINVKYSLFDYYGHKKATHIIVAMGAVCDTIEEVVDHLNENGSQTGLIKVRLFRPFSIVHFLNAIPNSVKSITVLDKTKEPGGVFDPLYLDVLAAISGSKFQNATLFNGRYGLASKDTNPEQIVAIFKNAENTGKKKFTVGIKDDVTHTSLESVSINLNHSGLSCKFWGIGSDGTVSATKNTIKIIGDATDFNIQGYFCYDSKKSLGLTVAHLRFGEKKIRSRYLITKADFVACNHAPYIKTYNILEEVKPGGIFLLNCDWQENELEFKLSATAKKHLALHKIQFYTIDCNKIAENLTLGNKTGTILQSAFFKLLKILPETKAIELMKEHASKTFQKQGTDVIGYNHKAIEIGMKEIREINVPANWANAKEKNKETSCVPQSQMEEIFSQIRKEKGNEIPVSKFVPFVDGVVSGGSSALEKSGDASHVPCWLPENCIQCNLCSYVCPHAVIRPIVLDQNQLKLVSATTKTIPMNGFNTLNFGITVSVLDCKGCGSCAEVCPGKAGKKALKMNPLSTQLKQQEAFDYGLTLNEKPEIFEKFQLNSVKGSQFKKPLLEFSGACAGCGETPYVKLLTQLIGNRLYIANATGCSSIWGSSFPSIPYTKNAHGEGPAWANSLFEDNAEFGYGIYLAQKLCKKDKTVWLIGGDGWAYDIGFGGLEHVMASNSKIKALILDTEVYSNTGGQASKATQTGAVTKFATLGKNTPKKDLAKIIMGYGYIYVAQIAQGADYSQTVKAITEAENYNGPAVVIAYAPCISHGIKTGLKSAQIESQRAVACGYWHLFRYNPTRKKNNENPFQLDSGKPTLSMQEFWEGETRYLQLKNKFPQNWELLLQTAQSAADEKYEHLRKLAQEN
jgi:pyruvate-ferredoxin/flavodoxin oxidoreductase